MMSLKFIWIVRGITLCVTLGLLWVDSAESVPPCPEGEPCTAPAPEPDPDEVRPIDHSRFIQPEEEPEPPQASREELPVDAQEEVAKRETTETAAETRESAPSQTAPVTPPDSAMSSDHPAESFPLLASSAEGEPAADNTSTDDAVASAVPPLGALSVVASDHEPEATSPLEGTDGLDGMTSTFTEGDAEVVVAFERGARATQTSDPYCLTPDGVRLRVDRHRTIPADVGPEWGRGIWLGVTEPARPETQGAECGRYMARALADEVLARLARGGRHRADVAASGHVLWTTVDSNVSAPHTEGVR